MHTKETRDEAKRLHKKGLPYTQISKKLGVAKSTLSTWIGRNPRTPSDGKRQREHLARIRILAAQSKRRIKQEWVDAARNKGELVGKKFATTDPVSIKGLLAMLYWAEGSKHAQVHGLIFVNTDPQLAFLYLSMLRKVYMLDETRLQLRLHLHHYHNHKESLKFWSELLSVPESQFGKIHVKKRNRHKRFRRNFQGICFIKYPDSTIREELLAMGRYLALHI